MVNQNLAEATEGHKLAVDYADLYLILDAMALLGFCQRKVDTTCSQKFLTWTGFGKFRKKFDGVATLHRWFKEWPETEELGKPEPYTREKMENEVKYKAGTPVERFVYEWIFRMMRSEERVLSQIEMKELK